MKTIKRNFNYEDNPSVIDSLIKMTRFLFLLNARDCTTQEQTSQANVRLEQLMALNLEFD